MNAPTFMTEKGMIDVILAGMFLMSVVLYLVAVNRSNRRFTKWPRYRMVCWILGVLSAAIAVFGSLDRQTDFVMHMIDHLLLGMLSPLLIVLSSPLTLILRSLHVHQARRLTKFLKSWPITLYHHPLVASLLNIGGLWLLYSTHLYHAMHHHWWIHLVVHLHLFFAGYLFTASMIYMDPGAHRFSFYYRAIVLILALAGHAILSKWIYAHPPAGVPLDQAEAGGMIMYYGGDLIDVMIIVFLCFEPFKLSRARFSVMKE